MANCTLFTVHAICGQRVRAVTLSSLVITFIKVVDCVYCRTVARCTHTHMSHRFLSGCKEVENHTSQLVEPHNFPHPRNTTLLHEFHLATTQILEHTPTQYLPTCLPHGIVCQRWSEVLANILDLHHCRLHSHLQGPSCEEVGNRTSQLPTTSQHHVLARI